MKQLALPLLILIAACGGSDNEINNATAQTTEISETNKDDFDFVNHQSVSVNITLLIEQNQEHLPFYLKLTNQNSDSNIYLGKLTREMLIKDIATYLPSIESQIRYEIFNVNGYHASGHLDI